jgi:hypothetical protein
MHRAEERAVAHWGTCQMSSKKPLPAATASLKRLSGPQLLFPLTGAKLRSQQQPLAEPAVVFDGGNGQQERWQQWTTKKAFNRGIGWGHCMVAVGFSGGDGQQQGGGNVAGGKRQGHSCNNQIEVTAVAVAAVVAALNRSDGQWLGGRQHNKKEGADNVRQGGDHRRNNQIEVMAVVAATVEAVAALNSSDGQWPGCGQQTRGMGQTT